MSGRSLVPSRMQSMSEIAYEFIANMMRDAIGEGWQKYFPYVFTLFIFIFVCNMLGMIPGFFTVTSHVAVTAALAVVTFFSIFFLGFIKHGPKFLTLFAPSGMPKVMLVFMVPIEMLSYFVRPITLAMRLFGNMLGGHVVMSLFGSFVIALALLGLSGGIATLAFLPSVLSFGMIVALTGLELVVAILQAFVFVALATVYLNEVVNFGHGH